VIFAREVSDGLTSLVKKIDAATETNRAARMGSFVVFCSDEEGLKKKLEELAEKEKLKSIVLTIDNPAGPEGYDIAKDADVTVLLYNRQKVKVNHAYKKGELTEREVNRIVSDLSQILPEKKD
jgi:hypothetical protein